MGLACDNVSQGLIFLWGRDVPLPSATRWSGERRELSLPQRGPGQSPGRYRILSIF